jgi:MoaA/NifB/PqqE/SkfB family radical SAM enzyme
MKAFVDKVLRRIKLEYECDTFLGKTGRFILRTPIYRFITWLVIARQWRRDLRGPFNITIETTNACNAKCVMCPHSMMKRKIGVMNDKTFDLILEKLRKENIPVNAVIMNGFGEPFMDSKFMERVRRVKKEGYKVKFHTNGSLIDDTRAKELIDVGVDEINISFNGTNQKNYFQVMQLNFERTVKNVVFLIKERNRRGLKRPIVRISSVLLRENEREVGRHIGRWQKLANSVTVTKAHSWTGKIKVDSDLKTLSSAKTWPCRALWHDFYIAYNGDFLVCCQDYEGKVVIGNIQKDKIHRFITSSLMNKWRKVHLKGKRELLPKMC